MDEIIKECNKRGITLLPYRVARFKNTKKEHLLSSERMSSLKKEDFEKYLEALWNVQSENAGGYDGWVAGHKALEELGFIKTEVTKGHRTFVSYKQPVELKNN